MRRRLANQGRRDRGAVIPMVALCLTVLMTMTAFAVDLGRMRTERRDLQADADAIALDAVQKIRGLDGPAAQLAAVTEANASAARNGFGGVLTGNEVKVGIWDPATQGFQYLGDRPGVFPNAVQVDLARLVEMFFDFSTDSRPVSRRAVAVARAATIGELGSVVAGVEPRDPTAGCAIGAAASLQMTIMNHLYSRLLGISVQGGIQGGIQGDASIAQSCQVTGPNDGLRLDAVSYNGIASQRLTYRDLASELAVGTPDELLDKRISQRRLLEVSAQALQRGQDPSSARYSVGTLFQNLAGRVDNSSELKFGEVFRGSSGTQDAVLDASINALDLLYTTATMINSRNLIGADSALTVPLPLGTGGALVNVPMKVHVIERPQRDQVWRYAGQTGPSTGQVRITLDVPVSVSNLGIDLSYLNLLGIGTPNTANATGSLPLVIEVGKATSSYPSIQCPANGGPSTVAMQVNSGAARVRVGTTNDTNFADGITVNTPGALVTGTSSVTTLGVDLLGVGISLGATVDMGQRTTLPAVIGQNFSAAGNSALNTGTDLTAGGGSASNPFTFTDPGPTSWYRYRGGFNNVQVADSVIGSFDFGAASSGALGLLTNELQARSVRNGVVQEALDPVLERLDGTVLQPLFNALGVTVGGADARILRVQCQTPALANRNSST